MDQDDLKDVDVDFWLFGIDVYSAFDTFPVTLSSMLTG